MADDLDELLARFEQILTKEAALERERASLEKEAAEYEITSRVGYELRKNPLLVWGAVLAAGERGDLPGWVRAYLHASAAALLALAGERDLPPKGAASR